MPENSAGWNLSIRTALLPKDTNHHGTIFGGVILSYIDMAGAIEAKRFCAQEVVTIAMKEVIFKKPVFVGDLITFYTRITHTGRTSISTEVKVTANRGDNTAGPVVLTHAHVTFVAVDETRNAAPIEVRANRDDPPAFSPDYLKERLQAE